MLKTLRRIIRSSLLSALSAGAAVAQSPAPTPDSAKVEDRSAQSEQRQQQPIEQQDTIHPRNSKDDVEAIGNHRRLFEVLHAEICRTKRTGREFSLLLLDLDGLKWINDQFGHQVGSRALCRLAEVLADCCRSVDTAVRHGGDEFALQLPETGPTVAALVGQRICDLLAKDTEEPPLSVSVGVAGYPQDAHTIGTPLYAADRALYAMKAKRPGSRLSPHSFSGDSNAEFHDNRE
jgi:diguanylate cyclase (GGDEF)-like protein